ncbi:PAS domain-containing protein [Ectothiorhodospiraceae bacterium BW-2]|nr:PAS domain-containing protein [Ectothiorhodospiraceae bacterium BW-2]
MNSIENSINSHRSDHRLIEGERWQLLLLLHLARIAVVMLLLMLAIIHELPLPLGDRDADLFTRISVIYLFLLLLTTPPLLLRRPRFGWQCGIQVAIDVAMITPLMYSSGGVGSGVAMLMVISIANHSMLTSGRMGLFFASLGTIALLLEQSFTLYLASYTTINYPYAALFGVVLFTTTQLTRVMARRAQQSAELAEQRSIDLENMAELAQFVITQLGDGVVVLDGKGQIRMVNQAASELLGVALVTGVPLAQLVAPLARPLKQWLRSQRCDGEPIPSLPSGRQVLIHCRPLGSRGSDGLLLLLEDIEQSHQRAQQLKLAALGQLTASIAHEIRNPLGAISHAGELLRESEGLGATDQRLSEIIHSNSRRLNQIIESILVLGRKDRVVNRTAIDLLQWLPPHLESFRTTYHLQPEEVVMLPLPEGLPMLKFDEGHLYQLLWNVCKNGLRHATTVPRLQLQLACRDERLCVMVIDSGPGIAKEDEEHLFEPFFTTESQGTGLGLYISKTLAEANHASLKFQRTERGESAFVLCGEILTNRD